MSFCIGLVIWDEVREASSSPNHGLTDFVVYLLPRITGFSETVSRELILMAWAMKVLGTGGDVTNNPDMCRQSLNIPAKLREQHLRF
jgi:hypothetical protein